MISAKSQIPKKNWQCRETFVELNRLGFAVLCFGLGSVCWLCTFWPRHKQRMCCAKLWSIGTEQDKLVVPTIRRLFPCDCFTVRLETICESTTGFFCELITLSRQGRFLPVYFKTHLRWLLRTFFSKHQQLPWTTHELEDSPFRISRSFKPGQPDSKDICSRTPSHLSAHDVIIDIRHLGLCPHIHLLLGPSVSYGLFQSVVY